MASQNEKTSLLGKTKQDYATILRWMSYANTEILTPLGGWFRPIIGRDPYNKKNVEDSMKAVAAKVKVMEDHLMINTYLVGERLTLADLFCASIVGRGYDFVFDKQWRDEKVYLPLSWISCLPSLEWLHVSQTSNKIETDFCFTQQYPKLKHLYISIGKVKPRDENFISIPTIMPNIEYLTVDTWKNRPDSFLDSLSLLKNIQKVSFNTWLSYTSI